MKPKFFVELLPDAIEFMDKLDDKSREKIYYNIRKSQFINDQELFKKLNGFIWEFRTFYNNNSYRLFSFWDNTASDKVLVIATHGIMKKAEELRKQYFNYKIRKKN